MLSLKTYREILRKKGFYTCLRELKKAVWPVWWTHSKAAIEQIQTERAGFHLIRQNYIGTTGQVVEETYVYKKLHLDIFIYIREGNDFYSVIQRRHETKEWKEANATDGFPCDRSYVPACDFERREFLGLKVYMPIETDGWLRAIYSDSYMTPIKNWTANGYKTRIVHSKERSFRKLY